MSKSLAVRSLAGWVARWGTGVRQKWGLILNVGSRRRHQTYEGYANPRTFSQHGKVISRNLPPLCISKIHPVVMPWKIKRLMEHKQKRCWQKPLASLIAVGIVSQPLQITQRSSRSTDLDTQESVKGSVTKRQKLNKLQALPEHLLRKGGLIYYP